MPFGDGTGPFGNGPLMGRRWCLFRRFGVDKSAAAFLRRLDPTDEIAALELQLKHLDVEKEYILKRLAELKELKG